MPMHQRDRFINIAVEEPEAENLSSRRSSMNIEHPTSNAEYREQRSGLVRPASIVKSQLEAEEFASPFWQR